MKENILQVKGWYVKLKLRGPVSIACRKSVALYFMTLTQNLTYLYFPILVFILVTHNQLCVRKEHGML